jgi:hypothetical protein
MKRLAYILVAISLMVGLIGVTGCAETEYHPGEGGPVVTGGELVILSHSMATTEYGIPVVSGEAKNVGDSTLSYAEVKVKFYDGAGNLLDTWLDNINDLGAGQTWKFEVMYIGTHDEDVASYEIGVGSCF